MLIDLMRDKFYLEAYKYFPDALFIFYFFLISNCKFIKSAKTQPFSFFTLCDILSIACLFVFCFESVKRWKFDKYLGRDMLIG